MNQSLLPFCLLLSSAVTNCTALPCAGFPFQQDDSIGLKNGAFSEWHDEQPVGWTVLTGATNGADSPRSTVRQGAGPSLELSGDANTKAWQAVSQSVNIQAGQTLRMRYSAGAAGIKREGNQYDNCFVGLFFKDSRGNKLPPQVWPVGSESIQDHSQTFRMPANAATAEIMIFLSKTGTLTVRDLSIESLKPKDSFDILVADMARHYSFLELKKVDWAELTQRYRDKALAADDPKKFAKVTGEMLGEFQDLHIWIDLDGQRIPSFCSVAKPNYDMRFVDKELKSVERIGNLGIVGHGPDGFVYIRVESLAGISSEHLSAMVAGIGQHLDAPGFVIDLRANGGGAEPAAAAIAGMFTDQEVVYARQKFRNGDLPGDFVENSPRVLHPTGKESFSGPVVCLIGPGTVSSGEGMAMMMKALPGCTLVGQPTRGASGNPQPVPLPNGVDVWYSRWISMLPDGAPIEQSGVPPDVSVEHVAGSDPTWLKAVEILRATTPRN